MVRCSQLAEGHRAGDGRAAASGILNAQTPPAARSARYDVPEGTVVPELVLRRMSQSEVEGACRFAGASCFRSRQPQGGRCTALGKGGAKAARALMPPVGPPAAGRKELRGVSWQAWRESLDRAAAARPDPGRPGALHRLNRFEYQSAIRDLLGLEVDVSSLLPKDEATHGFDNVSPSGISPALLERYLSAARKISRLAVGSPVRSTRRQRGRPSARPYARGARRGSALRHPGRNGGSRTIFRGTASTRSSSGSRAPTARASRASTSLTVWRLRWTAHKCVYFPWPHPKAGGARRRTAARCRRAGSGCGSPGRPARCGRDVHQEILRCCSRPTASLSGGIQPRAPSAASARALFALDRGPVRVHRRRRHPEPQAYLHLPARAGSGVTGGPRPARRLRPGRRLRRADPVRVAARIDRRPVTDADRREAASLL